MSFLQRLDELLRIKGMTRYQLRKETGISESTMSSWSKSSPSKKSLERLSEYFGISMDAILKGDYVVENKITVEGLGVLTEAEARMLEYFRMLDLDGRRNALDYLEMLSISSGKATS